MGVNFFFREAKYIPCQTLCFVSFLLNVECLCAGTLRGLYQRDDLSALFNPALKGNWLINRKCVLIGWKLTKPQCWCTGSEQWLIMPSNWTGNASPWNRHENRFENRWNLKCFGTTTQSNLRSPTHSEKKTMLFTVPPITSLPKTQLQWRGYLWLFTSTPAISSSHRNETHCLSASPRIITARSRRTHIFVLEKKRKESYCDERVFRLVRLSAKTMIVLESCEIVKLGL